MVRVVFLVLDEIGRWQDEGELLAQCVTPCESSEEARASAARARALFGREPCCDDSASMGS